MSNHWLNDEEIDYQQNRLRDARYQRGFRTVTFWVWCALGGVFIAGMWHRPEPLTMQDLLIVFGFLAVAVFDLWLRDRHVKDISRIERNIARLKERQQHEQ